MNKHKKTRLYLYLNRTVLSALSFSLLLASASLFAATSEADNYYRARRYDEAIEAYEQVLETLEPAEKAQALNRIAYSHERKRGRERDKTIEYHKKALEVSGAEPREHSYAYLRIGYNYQITGNPEKAIEYYKKVETVEEASPSHISEARLRSGWTSDDYTERTAFFRSVLEVDGGSQNHMASALKSLGNIYRERGDYGKALDYYGRFAELDDTIARRRRAAAYMAREMNAELEASDAFYIEPYTLFPEPDAVTVQWVSRESVKKGTGQLTLNDEDSPVASETIALRSDASEHILHRLRFEGLESGKKYEYEIMSGGEQREGSFRTASPEG